MKIKYNSEIIGGILFAIIGAVLWFLIPSQIPTRETGSITAQTIPRIAIGGMCIFGIGLLLEGVFAREKKEAVITKETFHSEEFKKSVKSAIFCLFLIAFCFMVKPLGFLISTAILAVAIMLFYGARKWYYYAIPLSMVGIVYVVFKVLLHVSLP